jgi:membrane protein YdbS with pleckstrin-like domain/uncharacterized Zn finger protein (UPF0148 family)
MGDRRMATAYEVRKGLLGHKVNYNCPACGAPLTSPLDKAGTNDTCPDCARPHTIPGSKERAQLENAKALEQLRQQREKEAAAKQKTASQARTVSQIPRRPQQPPPLAPDETISIEPRQIIPSNVPPRLRQLLNAGEKVVFAGNPSASVLIISLILMSVVVGVPLVILPAIALTVARDASPLIAILIGLLLTSLLLYIVYLNWRNQFYLITDRRTICKQGILNVAIKILPNHNIQLISINTGILDRLLGLNSIELSSAAAGSSGRILGVFRGMTSGGVLLRYVDVDRIMPFYAELANAHERR